MSTTLINRASAVLGLSAAALASTAALGAAPASAAETPSIAVHPQVVIYNRCGENFIFNANNVRIRASAGLSGTVEGYGERGQWFDANFRTSYEYGGYYWVHGTDLENGLTGYVALSLLTDEGPVGCTVLS